MRTHVLGCLVVAGIVGCLLLGGGMARAEDVEGDDPTTAKIRHLLRRTTFGVRPGDVEAVKKIGIEAWIDRQLDPQVIPDPQVEKRLEGYKTLKMTGPEYWRMLQGGQMTSTEGPPKEGEDRIARARRRQAELNRLRNMARWEVPQSLLIRAIYSERQLFEVLSEFWRNHFNVDVNKDDVRYYVADWEREVLARHIFGKFEDFLMATAKHPAMLFYLDNHVSSAPMARGERVRSGRENDDRISGLNENYARELMELHTVGVDNGYKQKDVIQLALILTGWSISGGRGADRGVFEFRQGYHARGSKTVMGKSFKNSGVKEGEQAIKYLARHKNTAWYVCSKLVGFLVADEPPKKLLADTIKVWRKTKGDLKEVTKAILMHPDFNQKSNVLTKAKTPFEFVASCLRVTGADIKNPRGLLSRLGDMGQSVYECEDPTGYSDAAADWMDTGVLAVRWQFAYDLLNGRMPGVAVNATGGIYDHVNQNPEVWEYLLVESVLANERPGSLTMAPFRQRVNGVRKKYRKMRPQELRREFNVLATLLLGSPEFQRQ